MALVGAQLPEDQIDWSPQLSGMGPEKTVSLFNPLSDDFQVIYARALPGVSELSPGSIIAREKAGLDLSKQGGNQKYVQQSIILKSGTTVNLPGDIAQKAVQDLVSYILGVRTKNARTADPVSRGNVEKEIIMAIKDTSEFLNQPIETPVEPVLAKTEEPPNPPPGQGTNYEPRKTAKTS